MFFFGKRTMPDIAPGNDGRYRSRRCQPKPAGSLARAPFIFGWIRNEFWKGIVTKTKNRAAKKPRTECPPPAHQQNVKPRLN